MATTASLSFSLPQRVLHWLTAGLVFFNLLFPDGMNAWNRSIKQTGAASAEQVASASIHAYAGIAILVLVAARLLLRQIQDVPAAPSEEPQMFKLVAKVSEWTLYLLLIPMPVTGAAAYYLEFEGAGDLHADVLKAALWAVVGLHVLGALAHQFYWKTNVLRRMTIG